jgi:hypothetical protein
MPLRSNIGTRRACLSRQSPGHRPSGLDGLLRGAGIRAKPAIQRRGFSLHGLERGDLRDAAHARQVAHLHAAAARAPGDQRGHALAGHGQPRRRRFDEPRRCGPRRAGRREPGAGLGLHVQPRGSASSPRSTASCAPTTAKPCSPRRCTVRAWPCCLDSSRRRRLHAGSCGPCSRTGIRRRSACTSRTARDASSRCACGR